MSDDGTIKFEIFEAKHENDAAPQDFTINFGAIAALEDQFKLQSAIGLNPLGASHLSFLAWHARKRDGQKVGEWKDWNLGLEWVVRKEAPLDEGPTEADAS